MMYCPVMTLPDIIKRLCVECMAFSRLTFRDTSGSCFERTPPLQMAQIKTKKDGALTKGGMVYAGRR